MKTTQVTSRNNNEIVERKRACEISHVKQSRHDTCNNYSGELVHYISQCDLRNNWPGVILLLLFYKTSLKNTVMVKGFSRTYKLLYIFVKKHLFSNNLVNFTQFRVVSCVLTFPSSVTPVMTSSGRAHGHVAQCEKRERLPSI